MCCMSGCANCVWLDYTDDMIKAYAKKGEKLDLKVILQEIDDNVSDPMIKSFIKMELKTKSTVVIASENFLQQQECSK